MNFLAHIYLSGDNDYVKIGNFIGDYIKGKQYLNYHPNIQKGILLHRYIDSFTDHNETAREVKSFLSEDYRKYAGVVVDIFYDHFLAVNWNTYSAYSLNNYINIFYQLLEENYNLLPKKVRNFLPRMIKHNRLLSYRDVRGIENALKIMAKTTSLPDKSSRAIEILDHYYYEMESNFNRFFPQIIEYVNYKFGIFIQYKKNTFYKKEANKN